jgi:Smg protein
VFDILAYLVERYYELGAGPDQETMSRQLAAAGFETQGIHQALGWLSGLQQPGWPHPQAGSAAPLHDVGATQARRGMPRLPALPGGALDVRQREVVLDRIMATEIEIGLDELKLVILLVLWNHRSPLDTLILDELLVSERVVTLH